MRKMELTSRSGRGESIRKTASEIKKLDKEGKVRFIVLYGSSNEAGTGEFSDVDIAVYHDAGDSERFSFRIAAQGRLGSEFDVQIFQDLPLYVRKEVVSRGSVLFYEDYDFLFNVYLQTLKEYADFEKHLNLYYSYLGGVGVEGTR